MRRKCRSLRMIEWSRHSRLTLPIRRSTYGFCHGLAVTPKCMRRPGRDLAALVVEHDEPEQEVERGRGDHEEIDRRQAIGVICKECPPRLRWRRWVTDHVFRDGGLGDGKAKLQKLAMDPRCAPPCILPRHPSDQIADLPRHRWSARLSPPRLPCPEKPEPLAVPTDDGLGPDNYQGVAPARP